jgi:NADP-dependent 3-hydroxy acid dehydrogenase YdfG
MSTSTKGKALVTGASSGHRRHLLPIVCAPRLRPDPRGAQPGRLDALAKRLAGETGRKIETVTADLNDKADLRRSKPCCAMTPGFTALVNNAGVGAVGSLLESDIDKMDDMIAPQCRGADPADLCGGPWFCRARRRHHHQCRIGRRHCA